MTELRWVLLALGAAVVIAVWLYGRRNKTRREPLGENLIDAVRDGAPPELTDVRGPGLSADEIDELGRGLQRVAGDDDAAAPASDQLILSLHVGRERPISGTELHPALIDAGLAFGRMDIYHHLLDDGAEAFSVANMLEPGTFNPLQSDELETPGVSLFAVLPGPLPGKPTLERMLSCARGLAAALGATVLDETRSALTRQTEAHLRERVAEFEARQRRG